GETMRVYGRVLPAAALLAALTGCLSIKLPERVVINKPDHSEPKPAPQSAAPCNPSDLPSVPPNERPPLAVLDYQAGESMDKEVGRALADLCRDAVQESAQVALVDRQRIADILGERDFAAAMRCDDTACLVEYGQLVGAQKMMHGRINQLGDILVLAVVMTDVATGKQVTQSASVSSIEASTDAIPDLVCQILQGSLGGSD
ncbi:MAG TPA: CsgG/HfaB family protein, partial [Phycisphaerae bacterium]|nr:CsgG/HfaB family protein [Phycisphaerae bacterium]